MNKPTDEVQPIDTKTALDSLASDDCPGCSKFKNPRKSFCGTCYRRLPGNLKRDLYKLIGSGYEQVLAESLKALGSTRLTTTGGTG